MIDTKILREETDKLKKATADKLFDPEIVDTAWRLDVDWREQLGVVEELRQERNVLSKKVTPANITRAKQVKQDLKKAEELLAKAEVKAKEALSLIPNPALPGVKVGKGEEENTVL